MAVGVTRPTIRAAILREMAPDPDDFISSSTDSAGTTTTLIDSTLASFRRKAGWFSEKVVYVPGAAAADQVRYASSTFDQATGTITVDRAVSASSVYDSGVDYEVFPIFGPVQVHDAINDALRRMEHVYWLTLHPESGAVDYDLTLKCTALRVHNRNKHLDFTEGTTGDATATIPEGVYDADDLAAEIEDQLNDAATDNTYTVTYSRTALQFTIARATGSATIGLEWSSGANTATTIGELLGFTVSADDTGATTYTSDTTVARPTWLHERRQVGVARSVSVNTDPQQRNRQTITYSPRESGQHVFANFTYQPFASNNIEFQALRPFDSLDDDDTETWADLTWLKSGAIRYLYRILKTKAKLGQERDTYNALYEDAEDEWDDQCNLHQGKIEHQLYGGA